MKKIKPTKHNAAVLSQLCKLIPSHLVKDLAQKYGVDKKARTFSPWSHVVSLIFAQISHSIGLHDVCDALRNHENSLKAIRGAKAPARNTLSTANRGRNSDMAEGLFWRMLDHLQSQNSRFAPCGRYCKLPRRFKKAIHAIDSTTIALVANCMDWAKHRRRKAAAKCHLRLNMQSFLPAFAIIEEASHHDDTRAIALCAGLKEGEIALFDKAYVNFKNLLSLTNRGIFWVTRAKDNMRYRVYRRNIKNRQGNILRDDIVFLKNKSSKTQYPQTFRRVEAEVEVDGKIMKMVFITNNTEWASSSVCDLYRCRWGIEVFFKQLKQTLQISDFLGHNKQAIRWQIWIALLLYLLLRFLAFMSQWTHSFTRLNTLTRGVLWSRYDLIGLLKSYGTAGGEYRMCASPQTAYLPGFSP